MPQAVTEAQREFEAFTSPARSTRCCSCRCAGRSARARAGTRAGSAAASRLRRSRPHRPRAPRVATPPCRNLRNCRAHRRCARRLGQHRQQREAFVAQSQATRHAPKQRHAAALFQVLDVVTDGRGRQVQRFGGAREVEVPGRDVEGPQGVEGQVHRGGRSPIFSGVGAQLFATVPTPASTYRAGLRLDKPC